jgi:hypothetical protein
MPESRSQQLLVEARERRLARVRRRLWTGAGDGRTGLVAPIGQGRIRGGVQQPAIVMPEPTPLTVLGLRRGNGLIQSGADEAVVSHGLGVTPGQVLATGWSPVALGVVARDEVAFTVGRVGTTGNLPFDWVALGELVDLDPVELIDATSQRTSSVSSSVTVPRPASAATGDLLLAATCVRGVATVTPPTGWTLVDQVQLNGGSTNESCSVALYWRIQQQGDPTTWAATLSGSFNHGTGVICVRQFSVMTPIGDWSISAGSSSTPTWPSVDVGVPGSLLYGVSANVQTTGTFPDGTTGQWNLGSASGGLAAGRGWTLADVDTGATGSFSATQGGGSRWATVLAVVNPG